MKFDRARRMTRRAGALGALLMVVTLSHYGMAASEATQQANERFWSTLHEANYAEYPKALAAVEAALALTPNDAVQNARLGWLHMWHLSEAGNFRATPQDMAADLRSAEQQFKLAVALAPHEARYLGFYATTQMIESALSSDAAGSRLADAALDRAIRMWPQFNLFTAGYIHSSEPADSPEYATAMKRMWKELDICAGRHISRTHPEFSHYGAVETTVGPKRACWNSSIAPHNLEGFFLNFGDMIVKSGDVAAAQAMYANARLSATYADWAYRDDLERRIVNAQVNVNSFRESPPADDKAKMMVQSDFSCMACHRR